MLAPILLVKDMEKTLEFYTKVLGFKEDMRMPGPDGQLVHASVSWKDVMIMFGPATAWLPAEDVSHLGAGVDFYIQGAKEDDLDQYYEMLKQAGVEIVKEIEDQFWGDRTFSIKDPSGFQLTFAKPVREVPPEEMMEAVKQMG